MKTLHTLAFSALMLIFATALSLLGQMVEAKSFNSESDLEQRANLEQVHTQPIDGVLVMNDAINYPIH